MEIFLAKTQSVIRFERFSKILSPITTLHLNQLTNSCRNLTKRLETTLLHYSRNLQSLLPGPLRSFFYSFNWNFQHNNHKLLMYHQ